MDDLDEVEQVRQRVVGLMRQLHRLQADQPADFVVEASDTLASATAKLDKRMAPDSDRRCGFRWPVARGVRAAKRVMGQGE